ncbi:MAG: hypothetical protein ACLQGT_16370 [Terracidiphilus sp.]
MEIKFFRVEFTSTVFKEERKDGIMQKTRFVVMPLVFATMLSIPACLLAQSTAANTAAPLPSQILIAKKVFISNAGSGLDQKLWSGGPTQPYIELYAAIKSWGQYQLVATPADADLVLQISYSAPLTDVGGSKDSGSVSFTSPQLKLALLDPKTGIILWALNEKTSIGHLEKGRDQALADSIAKLVSDLKALTAQPAAAAK